MKKSRFSDDQIVGFLKQAEAGMAVKVVVFGPVRLRESQSTSQPRRFFY